MGEHVIVKSRRVFFDYEILETFEAGIVLEGPEIKSIRSKDVSVNESFILLRKGEAFVINMNIKKYEYTSNVQYEETRNRKLLLTRKELDKLLKRVKLENLTIVPIRLYLKGNYAKLEIGLARGKKTIDKREIIKARDIERRLNKSHKL